MKQLRTFGLAAAFCALNPIMSSAETWNLPNAYPDNNFQTENLRWLADEVAKATKGELTFVVHSGASMFKMAELKRAVRTGQVPIAEFILSSFGNEDAMYEADSVPFLAVGQTEAMKLYKIQAPMLKKRFDKEGLIALYSVPWPGNSLFTQIPVDSFEAFRGMKMRGQTPAVARLVELLGAVPVNVQFVEIPQAFQTGVVTGMFTAGTTGVDTQAWDYCRYFYDTAGYSPRDVVAVNAKAWGKLPEAIRKAVTEVAKRAETRGWKLAANLEVDARKVLTQHGIKVIDPSNEMMAQFRKVGDQMIAEWVKRAGPDGDELVRRMREK
jgi:TRAP-type C4-dicarboxylate transport system substrate-binding protein